MDNIEIYSVWANEKSIWTPWTKPVLFAAMTDNDILEVEKISTEEKKNIQIESISSSLKSNKEIAVILDLPGEESVITGLDLAKIGFILIPLFNGTKSSAMIINVTPIIHALIKGTNVLRNISIIPDSPPVFLLDANRLQHDYAVLPGNFDNRWCVLPQDMPSANFLKQNGIKKVLLVSNEVQDDLSHILCRYQESDLDILVLKNNEMQKTVINKPSSFKSLFYRVSILMKFKRNSTGGFGYLIPDPASYGGGFG
ncbi:hypothetical protein HY745_08340 [Candidatus Desantisbacteria bacterium]|nr:hypothetical protein [Candidatus Desantisbacteria bacterium]